MFERISDYVDYHANRQPDTEALVLGNLRYDYSELKSRVDRCALALLDAGIEKGDRVATLSTPHPDFFVTFLAAASIGAIWIGLNPKYSLDEYRYVIGNARPRLVISRSQIEDRNLADDIAVLADEFDCLEAVVFFEEKAFHDAQAYKDFIQKEPGPDDLGKLAAVRAQVKGSDPAMIVYTSGTTGKPKGALIPHQGLARVAHVQNRYWHCDPIRAVNFLPINHIGCVGDIACFTYVNGGTIVFMEHFDPAACLQVVQDEKITFWGAVPTAFQLCLALPDFNDYDLSCLQLVIWGGAKAPANLIRKLATICPRLSTSFGQTESVGSVTFVEPCSDIHLLSRSVGQPVPEYGFRLADEAGNPVPTGETGEIQVRGDFIMLGYWENPRATAEAIQDGWLKTGDLGVQGSDGHVKLVGRLKEMFISGGYNVFPLEVEQVLESHPAIAMAAVVSVPDELFSEVGHAWVLVETGQAIEADEIFEFCKERLANYKVPKHVFTEHELPMLPIGKLDRSALKDRSMRAIESKREI
jgi:fatty-acyl-CoA synthase